MLIGRNDPSSEARGGNGGGDGVMRVVVQFSVKYIGQDFSAILSRATIFYKFVFTKEKDLKLRHFYVAKNVSHSFRIIVPFP